MTFGFEYRSLPASADPIEVADKIVEANTKLRLFK